MILARRRNCACVWMKRLVIGIALFCLTDPAWAACPSRSFTYTAGQAIEPAEVTTNEQNAYDYLCAGVDTYKSNSITSATLQDGAVTSAKLGTGAVTTTVILDNTITTTDLNATLTLSDADYLDLSAILHDDTALQGLRLPQIGATPSSPTSGEGQIGWDETNNMLEVYNGTSWANVSPDPLTLTTAGPATPVANTLYTDNIVKGWCYFVDGGTAAITDDFNVASIADNGTGDYTITWETDLANANYAVAGTATDATTPDFILVEISRTAGTTRVGVSNSGGTAVDAAGGATVLVIGD